MNEEKLNALAKQMVKELQQEKPIATIAGAQLPTFDSVVGCSDCPCDNQWAQCPCIIKT